MVKSTSSWLKGANCIGDSGEMNAILTLLASLSILQNCKD